MLVVCIMLVAFVIFVLYWGAITEAFLLFRILVYRYAHMIHPQARPLPIISRPPAKQEEQNRLTRPSTK